MPTNPRFRFSLRTLFVVVTLVAMLCVAGWVGSGWLRRSAELRERASEHERKANALYDALDSGQVAPMDSEYQQRLMIYHLELSAKYGRASYRPWSLVEPDPPEPTP